LLTSNYRLCKSRWNKFLEPTSIIQWR